MITLTNCKPGGAQSGRCFCMTESFRCGPLTFTVCRQSLDTRDQDIGVDRSDWGGGGVVWGTEPS